MHWYSPHLLTLLLIWQSAILGMHSIVTRPMVVGGNIVPRPMMYIALTYDHRLIDGREAVFFLRHIKDVVEDPRRLLLDIWSLCWIPDVLVHMQLGRVQNFLSTSNLVLVKKIRNKGEDFLFPHNFYYKVILLSTRRCQLCCLLELCRS